MYVNDKNLIKNLIAYAQSASPYAMPITIISP